MYLGTLWRLLNKRVRVDDSELKVILLLITREFEEVLGVEKRLIALDVVCNDGTVNCFTAIGILKRATRNEYLKQPIIRFITDNFREDVKHAIGSC